MPTKITFSNEASRKAYAAGLAQAAARVKGHHKLTAQELAADSITKGRAEILKRFGRDYFKKCFGTEPPRAMAPAPLAPATVKPQAPTAPARKTYAQPVPERPRSTLHRYVCREWLAPV